MKISVIIPVFNAEKSLTRCLDSVISQTYEDLEILLINDGSTDRSGSICENYADKDSRITVFHTENRGPSAARNVGLEAASGDWIAFVDSDDYIDPALFTVLLEKALAYEADLVQCGALAEASSRAPKPIFSTKRDVLLTAGAGCFRPDDWRLLNNANWGKLYRHAAVGELRFDPICRIGEDLQFNLRFLAREVRVVLSEEIGYHYVLTEDSLFRKKPSREQLLNCREMLERLQRETVDQAMLRRIWDERYRNALDICSKIVGFRLTQETDIRKEIQREMRDHMGALLTGRSFSGSEKMKFLLIAWFWPLYRGLLTLWKRCDL